MSRQSQSETQPPPVITVPKPLPTWKVVLFGVLLPITVSMAIIAIAGLWVLSDLETKTSWISQTHSAQLYRDLIQWNPFFSAFFFNGGIFGTMYCLHQLYKHNQARLLKGVKFVNAKDAVKQARKKK